MSEIFGKGRGHHSKSQSYLNNPKTNFHFLLIRNDTKKLNKPIDL